MRYILCAIAIALIWPVGFGMNESVYFMLAHRYVEPEAFSEWSAAFDDTNARFLTNSLMGYSVESLGYDVARYVLSLLMIVLYAGSIGFAMSALGLTIAENFLLFIVYWYVGPDLMGAEWLFNGVEAKTFAYAAVFMSLGFYWLRRPLVAMLFMALGTYLHFLVGGFWAGALLFFMLLRGEPLLRTAGVYAALVAPMFAIVVMDQLHADPRAAYLYAVIAVPFHAEPFTDLYRLGHWIHGVVATAGATAGMIFLARRAHGKFATISLWLAYLLGSLLVLFPIMYFDMDTGTLGKFLPFRHSALTLFLTITIFLLALRELTLLYPRTAVRLLLMILTPVFVWDASKDTVKHLFLHDAYDVEAINEYLDYNSNKEDIVLTDPRVDMTQVHLPRLLNRPTLVSMKYVPSDPRGLDRWHGLLDLRDDIYAGRCVTDKDPPVRFVLYVDREPEDNICGSISWENEHYSLVKLTSSSDGP